MLQTHCRAPGCVAGFQVGNEMVAGFRLHPHCGAWASPQTLPRVSSQSSLLPLAGGGASPRGRTGQGGEACALCSRRVGTWGLHA